MSSSDIKRCLNVWTLSASHYSFIQHDVQFLWINLMFSKHCSVFYSDCISYIQHKLLHKFTVRYWSNVLCIVIYHQKVAPVTATYSLFCGWSTLWCACTFHLNANITVQSFKKMSSVMQFSWYLQTSRTCLTQWVLLSLRTNLGSTNCVIVM